MIHIFRPRHCGSAGQYIWPTFIGRRFARVAHPAIRAVAQ